MQSWKPSRTRSGSLSRCCSSRLAIALAASANTELFSVASAAMGVPDDGATKVKLQRRSCAVLPRCRQLRLCLQDDLVAGTGATVPHVPSEVEWKPTDVDGMTLDELKEREARKR